MLHVAAREVARERRAARDRRGLDAGTSAQVGEEPIVERASGRGGGIGGGGQVHARRSSGSTRRIPDPPAAGARSCESAGRRRSAARPTARPRRWSAPRECACGRRRRWSGGRRRAARPVDPAAPPGSPAPVRTPPWSSAPRRSRTRRRARRSTARRAAAPSPGRARSSSRVAANAMAMPPAAASMRDQRRFEQQLAHHPRSRCAHRGANRQLALPAGAARQQQVDDVAAGDQQHERHRAEQHEQRAPRRLRDQPVVEAVDHARPSPCSIRDIAVRAARRSFRARCAPDRSTRPALTRPITESRWSARLRAGSGASGASMSVLVPQRNDAGSTPMIV